MYHDDRSNNNDDNNHNDDDANISYNIELLFPRSGKKNYNKKNWNRKQR